MFLPRALPPAGPLQGSGGVSDWTALVGIVMFCTPFLLFPLAKWYVDRNAAEDEPDLTDLDGSVPAGVTETLEPRLNDRLSDLDLTRTLEDDAVVYRTPDGAEVGRLTANGGGVALQYRDADGDLLDVPASGAGATGVHSGGLTEADAGPDGDVDLEALADSAAERFRARHDALADGEGERGAAD